MVSDLSSPRASGIGKLIDTKNTSPWEPVSQPISFLPREVTAKPSAAGGTGGLQGWRKSIADLSESFMIFRNGSELRPQLGVVGLGFLIC